MRSLTLFFALFLLAGCAPGRHIDYNKASLYLQLGMNKSEVVSTLGDPRRTDVNEGRERWIYWNRVFVGFTPIDNESLAQDRLVVTFKNGKVVRWGNQTLGDDMMEASQKIIESSYQSIRPPARSNP